MRRWSSLLGLVPLLGLAELALQQHFAHSAPEAADYAALAPQLLALKPAGVPVVVAPAWAEPLLRQAAPEAFPLAELARADDRAFGAFLEVSLLEQTAPELRAFPIRQAHQLGAFRVSLRENPAPDPTRFDFVSAVERGEVEVFTELGDERAECESVQRQRSETGGLHGHVAYPQKRHECARGRIVGVTLIDDQDYRARRCIIAQMPDSGSVVLRFDAAPATPRLVGFVGASYFLERDSVNPQVELSVSEAGRPLLSKWSNGASGWTRFEARRGDTGAIEVRLRRLAPSRADFCFSLEAR
jgi:hypothetical protein